MCDAPSLLVWIYARGLLSVYTINFDPSKHSLNFLVTDILKPMALTWLSYSYTWTVQMALMSDWHKV